MVILLLDHGANVNARDDQTNCSSLLHIAASNRHTLLVRDLLLRGAYVNIFNTDEQSPLLAAVASGSIEIVEMLLRAGADINVTDSFGHTPLNSAASTGHALILSLLLTANASRDSALQHNNKLRSLLELAFVNTTYDVFSVIVQQIKKRATGPRLVPSDATLQEFITTSKYDPKRLWVLGILFSNGLDINAHIGQYGGLLHYAAGWGRLELVEFLIQPRELVEVDINMFNKGLGETPLQLAASMCGGDEPAAIISKLLSKGANSRLGGPKYGSILHAAVNMPVYQGHETNFSKSSSVVKKLLEHDEQAMHVIGGDQGTVLQSAVMGGNTDMVKLLLERGARREYSDSPSGRHGTAVHAAIYNPDHPVIDLLKSLRLYRTDFEIKDQEGRLPLHIAASRLQGRLFKTMCGVYNNVKYRDSQGRTALHFAAGRGRAANAKAILAQDPSLIHEADEDGWTPLHWACRSSDLPTIQLLLDEGARVEDVTKRGWLPRDVAVWHDSIGISKVETPEDFAPSVEPSILGEDDVETNARVYKAARLATWTSLRTSETWTSARCDSCECDIYDMRYTCKTCWDMDYCFKCFRNIKLIQHHGSHIFSKLNPESEEVDTINPWVHEKELEGLMDGDPAEEIHTSSTSDGV